MPTASCSEQAVLLAGSTGALYTMLYQPPLSEHRISGQVLICPPIANEMVNCQRILVHIARTLALRGWPVCRLDYYGTGESEGEFIDCDVNHCVTSIIETAEHLVSSSDQAVLVLVGMRLGGLFASVAARRLSFIKGLVLIDAVPDPKRYLKELQYAASIASFKRRAEPLNRRQDSGALEVAGFSFSTVFCRQLAQHPVLSVDGSAAPVLILLSSDGPDSGYAERVLEKRYWTKRDVFRAPLLERELLDWIGDLDRERKDAQPNDH